MVAATLDEVDDALFQRAERAASNADQERHFVAMRQLRLQRRDIETRFLAAVEAAFDRLIRGESPQARARTEPDGLELMDEAVVEENVAVDTVVGKGRSRQAFPLAQLLTRLNHMLGSEVDEEDNPLDPRQIVGAFALGLQPLEIEIGPRLVLYKIFEKHLLRHLGEIYDAANRALIDAGVLPRLHGTGHTGDRGEEGAPPMAAPGTAASSTPASASAGESESVLAVLSRLIAEAKYGGGGATADAVTVGDVTAGGSRGAPVVEALSGLQREWRPPAESAADSEAIKAGLARALARLGHAGGIGRGADDTIDIVSMLFEVILEDPRLAAAIKAQLARLQIPVLKVAFLDRAFFGSRQHPARQLINEMARAAAGWAEPEDLARDPLYGKMREVVERVLEGFGQDMDVFATVLDDFRRFLEQEQERARVIEDRTRQAAEGKARVADARERAQAEVDRRLAEEPPEVVRRLLGDAWFQVLFITLAKDGEEAESWRRHLDVMDRLVWSVRPKTESDARRRMLADMPMLLRDLRDGLNGIRFNPSEMTRLFRELEVEHIRCLSEPAGDGAADSGPAAPAPEADASDAFGPAAANLPEAEQPVGEPVDDEYLSRLQAVDLGTWFEFCDDRGREQRAKLSARLNGGRRLIFVNRAGFKLADRPVAEVAAALQTGRAVVLDDNALFDRALENVISNLKDMRAAR